MNRKLVSLFLFFALAHSAAATAAAAESTQLILVKAKNWNSHSGWLQLFERESGQEWKPALPPMPVSLGKNGLAWGNGAHLALDSSLPIEKHEGDGKTPAGIFPIPFALGFEDPQDVQAPGLPYVQLNATTECIDFTDSGYYNQVLDWSGIDELKPRLNPDPNRPRPRGLLKVGFFIGQNTQPALPGRGSCVYLHLRQSPQSVTAGCTAIDEPNARALLRKIDQSREPQYVVLPEAEYQRYRTSWDLP